MSRTSAGAIDSYVTDMLALEEHIVTAVQGQQEHLKGTHPEFTAVLRELNRPRCVMSTRSRRWWSSVTSMGAERSLAW